MLGVLGAEFGQSVSGGGAKSSEGVVLEGFSGVNMTLARHTCHALSYLLMHPPPRADRQNGELRRAAIHLIGRGFTIWEPYMDITRVILALLELASDTKVDYDQSAVFLYRSSKVSLHRHLILDFSMVYLWRQKWTCCKRLITH